MIPYQPKWKGRKKIRHLVAALTIGTATISLHYVYSKVDTPTENGWKRETVFVRSIERHSKPPEILSVTVFLLNGTSTWTVPSDFMALVSVETIGAGSSGNADPTASKAASGAGGAYAKITSTSTTLTPGVTVINVGIGLGGVGVVTTNDISNAGGNTWWNATSLANAVTLGSAVACASQGGQAAGNAVAGPGGTAANSVGTTKFSGGNGFVTTATAANGSGGAAGPSGAGGAGTVAAGGSADNATVAGPTVTANGNSGTEFNATHGCGTGAFTSTGTAQSGGLYGGGGTCVSSGTSGAGANGLLVITYTTVPVFDLPPNTNFISSRRHKVVAY